MFSFYSCDLSFNGTTVTRGQIPALLYCSTPLKPESINGKIRTEIHARDTALKVGAVFKIAEYLLDINEILSYVLIDFE